MTKSYPADHEGLLAELDALVTPIPHSTLMMRRAVYEAVGGYRPVFAKAQDYDLLRRLARAGRLASLSAPLVRLRVSRGSMTDSTGDGEQLSYGVLAYAADKVRGCSGADPLDGASAAEFMRDFHRWYPQSRYPRMFRSRLARRAARVFLSERRPVEGTLALVRATAAYPGWPFQRAGVGPDPAKDARVWAESWARRTR